MSRPASLRVTRTVRFSAAHRQDPGRRMRGHDYRLDVTLDGEPDPTTGMFVNLAELDAVLKREVVAALHERQLDVDIPQLAGRPVSCETLTLCIVDMLATALRPFAPARLALVRVHESEDLHVEWEPS